MVDVGCGRGLVGALCRIYRDASRIVGLDAYRPYLDFCMKFGFYHAVIGCDFARNDLPFRDKKFDLATCVEVVEHLEKSAGQHLIGELERVANRVIITTPGTYFEQAAFDENLFQRHVSKWSVTDFEKRGYEVRGLSNARILARFPLLAVPISPLLLRFPRLSTSYLCTKNMASENAGNHLQSGGHA